MPRGAQLAYFAGGKQHKAQRCGNRIVSLPGEQGQRAQPQPIPEIPLCPGCVQHDGKPFLRAAALPFCLPRRLRSSSVAGLHSPARLMSSSREITSTGGSQPAAKASASFVAGAVRHSMQRCASLARVSRTASITCCTLMDRLSCCAIRRTSAFWPSSVPTTPQSMARCITTGALGDSQSAA